MNKKILLTGADGQLGQSILRESSKFPSFTFIPTDQHNLDITNPQEVSNELDKIKPDYIINTAAYTNVDGAESDYDTALTINSTAVNNLAVECKKRGIFLVHYSTDYVFSGEKKGPYYIHDKCTPLNIYGKTKWLGEQAIVSVNPNALIIRTSWIFSIFNTNFVKTMINLASKKEELSIIKDQIGQPTSAHDLASFTLNFLFQNQPTGLDTIHFSNKGICSWHEFASEIIYQSYNLHIVQKKPLINAVTSEEYPQKATRPKNSVLDISDTEARFNVNIRNWKDALNDVLILISNAKQETIDG
ncbi:dTDP-4-dehydrorhamnose reductase [Zooshikella ganghwensis]|uniref:dTDP-4-dehydrorhamnose reductase n=1 Tax=Zooshikella ganghwensis TaxID=202772 RepID=A0A4P9VKX8_9GAMM|nr:dTDP-4-dehydrorhamnose reductase [Zooshikella ganghwensis]RDH42472.1 dTDP-4-dehydrorhamnose reductase [Zooshikella ganghwensis]